MKFQNNRLSRRRYKQFDNSNADYDWTKWTADTGMPAPAGSTDQPMDGAEVTETVGWDVPVDQAVDISASAAEEFDQDVKQAFSDALNAFNQGVEGAGDNLIQKSACLSAFYQALTKVHDDLNDWINRYSREATSNDGSPIGKLLGEAAVVQKEIGDLMAMMDHGTGTAVADASTGEELVQTNTGQYGYDDAYASVAIRRRIPPKPKKVTAPGLNLDPKVILKKANDLSKHMNIIQRISDGISKFLHNLFD